MILAGVVILTVLSVFLIFQPILTGQKAPSADGEGDFSDLTHRKRMALLALRDVEYDYHAGKLDEEDYKALKSQVAAEALEALEALEVEAEVASRNLAEGAARVSASGVSMAEVEAEISEMRRSIREGAICTQCGHPNPKGSRFCAECGTALAVQGVTPA